MIYLDNAATAPLLPCAKAAMELAPFGNPSSAHAAGREARNAIEQARATIAACIDCEPEEVYFTSGATEACAIMAECANHVFAVLSCASPFEHSAVSENVSYWPDVEPNIHILANNETGQIYDFLNMKPYIRGKDCHIIGTDATAAVGHIPVSFKELGVDYMAFGAHKFGGPMGVGCLIARKGAYLLPIIRGGGQERGMRGGTESAPLICGMAAALKQKTDGMDYLSQFICKLRDTMVDKLWDIPGFHINGPYEVGNTKNRLPGNLNIRFDGVSGSAMVMWLSEHGVCVSTGSACSSGSESPSRVLLADGLTREQALSSIRITIDEQNTLREILEAAKIIRQCVESLRGSIKDVQG